jgi:hypothetical protein
MRRLRLLSLFFFVCFAFSATASYAQPKLVVGTWFTEPTQPGGGLGVWVDATISADAPGPATATLDPIGLGQSTFVLKLESSTSIFNPSFTPCPAGHQCFEADFELDFRLSLGTHQVPVTVTDSKGRRATVPVVFQVVAATDRDHDGLPDAWENAYGLNSASADGDDGPSGDPDGDGVSNLDEFRAGTNPRAKYVRYFAEGSSGDAQPLQTCVNVLPVSADYPLYEHAHVIYVGDNGRQALGDAYIANWGSGTCPLSTSVADRVSEIRVESMIPIAVERDTTSGHAVSNPNYLQLANASLGVQEPSRTWVFADGHTADGMDMFLLLFNPGSDPVTANLTYTRAPSSVVAQSSRVLPPGVRTTIWVNQDQPDALGDDVSVSIAADAGILAERAYRFHSPGRTVPHDSVTRGGWMTGTHWYFPDMDSRGPFTTSVVVMNPSARATQLTVTTQFADRSPNHMQVALTAGERRELTLRDLPAPANTTFGVVIDTSDGVGIVAERAASGVTDSGAWRRSTLGTTQPGTRWVFPSSGDSGTNRADLVVLNTADTPAHVRVSMRFYGFECCDNSEAFFDVPARGTVHVPIGSNDPARTISVLSAGPITVESVANGSGAIAPIVVERTTYWDQDGVVRGRATSMIGNQVQ